MKFRVSWSFSLKTPNKSGLLNVLVMRGLILSFFNGKNSYIRQKEKFANTIKIATEKLLSPIFNYYFSFSTQRFAGWFFNWRIKLMNVKHKKL